MTWSKMVVLDLGCILKLDPIEFVYGLDVKSERNRVYMSVYIFKNICSLSSMLGLSYFMGFSY